MKSKNIFWGVFFISLGLLFLLDLSDIKLIDFGQVFDLWPLILIFIGIKILIKNNIVSNISLVLASIFLALIFYTLIFNPINCNGIRFYKDRDWNERSSESISYQFNQRIKNASLNIEFEAGEMKIVSDKQKLIDGEINFIKKYNYLFDGEVNDSTASFRLESRNDKSIYYKIPNEKYKNYLNLKIHPETQWDIDIYTNLSKCSIDFSNNRIANVHFNGNFTKSKIEFGKPESNTNLNFDINFSNLKIKFPEDVEYEIKIDKNFSSFDIKNLIKVDDQTYKTKNFEQSNQKYFIRISSNFSSITIN